jgi:UDP-N-acetylmuramoyl-tripeptide--D-alanyl-D-alanine ligase
VAKEKASLLWALPAKGTAIYNADDAVLTAELGCVRARRRLAFGRCEQADVRLVSHALDASARMVCELFFRTTQRPLHTELAIFGAGPALDAAAAMAVVLAVLGEGALEPAARGLGDAVPAPGRLCPVPGASGALILDDSYNANPASMHASIDTALELARARGGRALLILGDMLELGDASRAAHEAVGKQAAQPGVAAFLACGVEMTAAVEAAREHARRAGYELSVAHLSDPLGAAQLLLPLLRPGDVVLVKGSRSMGMERVVEGLTQRTEGGP